MSLVYFFYFGALGQNFFFFFHVIQMRQTPVFLEA